MFGAEVRDEIRANSGTDIGIAGRQTAAYAEIAAAHAGSADRDVARVAIGNLFADGEHVSTNKGMTYRQYYGGHYAGLWDKHGGKV